MKPAPNRINGTKDTLVPEWIFPAARLVEINPDGELDELVLPAEVLWVRDGNIGISAPNGYFYIENSKVNHSSGVILTDLRLGQTQQRRFLSARDPDSFSLSDIELSRRSKKWLRGGFAFTAAQ